MCALLAVLQQATMSTHSLPTLALINVKLQSAIEKCCSVLNDIAIISIAFTIVIADIGNPPYLLCGAAIATVVPIKHPHRITRDDVL